ncbi:MAG TPA: calcium-binding protein, partial [Aquabacterium sp.]|nr:calcium-binding protein [Aquabacterium sp.]
DALYGLGAASGYYGRAASGASTLWGGAGNDTLFADVASDVLIGGAGSDTYSLMTNVSVGAVREFRIDPGTDGGSLADVEQVNMISWVGADVWDVRRLGNDLVLVARTGQSAVVRVVNNFVINPLTGQEEGLIDRIQMNSGAAVWDAAEILRRTTLDNTIPTDGADVLTGTAFDDLFQGSPGDDSLVGWGGADTLIGGEGADTMRGGRGNDVYFVDSSLDRVHEYKMTDSYGNLVSEGVDEVHTNLSEYTLPDNVENLVMGGKLGSAPDQRGVMTGKAGVRHGIGNGYDNLMTGGPGDEWFEGAGGLDRLLGGAGNDTLEGGSGRDTLEGGLGDDVYFLRQRFYGDSDIDDKIIERSDEGIDTVDTDLAAYTAAANIEQVFTTGASVTGNELNNVLRGGGTATVLSGMSGHDTLEGGGGGDTYRGGLGNDLLLAADVTSNDTFIWGIGDGADTIVDAGGGADQLNITGGSLPEQVWFSRSGDDLLVSIIGTTDSVTVSRWFVDDGAHRIERMTLADGQDILAAGVESLVNEMAAFAPPLEGQMSLPADVRASLSGVITTAWAG